MRLIDANELKIDYGFTWDDITPTHEEIYALIDRQPTIEAEPKWIPCSKRLPEDTHEVLCCTDEDEMFVATAYVYEDGYDFDDNEGMAWRGEVVAWMPLPKPYEAERKEE